MEDKNVSSDDIKRINQELSDLKDTINSTYSKVYDDIEEREFDIRKLLESGILSEEDADYFWEKKRNLYKTVEYLDEEKNKSLKIVNQAILDNEQYEKNISEEKTDSKEGISDNN